MVTPNTHTLTYETLTTGYSGPTVSLSYNGQHLGTIWGAIHKNEHDDFETKQGIVYIRRNGETIAILWNTQPKP